MTATFAERPVGCLDTSIPAGGEVPNVMNCRGPSADGDHNCERICPRMARIRKAMEVAPVPASGLDSIAVLLGAAESLLDEGRVDSGDMARVFSR